MTDPISRKRMSVMLTEETILWLKTQGIPGNRGAGRVIEILVSDARTRPEHPVLAQRALTGEDGNERQI